MKTIIGQETDTIIKNFLESKSLLIDIINKVVKGIPSEKCAAILKEKTELDLQPIDRLEENPERIPRILRDPLETIISVLLLRELEKNPDVMVLSNRRLGINTI